MPSHRFCTVLALGIALVPASPAGAAGDTGARAKILAAFAGIKSYRVTVLGSVRSLGVWVAPNKYQMTTEFDGKPVKTIIVGHDYWIFSEGRWQKSGTASNNLDVDIAGLVRTARSDPSAAFVPLPDQTQDGKRVGTFEFTFKNGNQETCNYNPSTYLVTRCKTDELTLLYSGYNDPANRVANPK
jgi:hypothetical protein